MKKTTRLLLPVMALMLGIVSFWSCSDEWDTHYSEQSTGKLDKSLIEYIDSRSDLKMFAELLHETGYDTILGRSQSYTVWAPTDEAISNSSSSGQLLNLNLWGKIAANHIAGYSHPVSQADSLTLTMINGKLLKYNTNSTGSSIDGVRLVEKDKALTNGLLHVIDDILPFRYNQWEYIQSAYGLDSIRNYINSMSVVSLDSAASYKGETLVDSIFKTKNPVLDNLGSLNKEDSIYTSLLPSNAGFNMLYDNISQYFVTKTEDGGAAAQRTNTLWTMVSNLFMWGAIEAPVGNKPVYNTIKNKLTNADELFGDALKVKLSNGFTYVADDVKLKPTETWNKEIRIEAEDAFLMSNKADYISSYDLFTYSSLGTGYSLSGDGYLYCKSKSGSPLSSLHLYFPIPNTLSCKYNIYAVFVPTAIVDTTDKRPYKLEFSLSLNANTTKVPTYTKVVVPNNITNGTQVSKILIAQNYKFDYANIISGYGLVKSKTTNDKIGNRPAFAIKIKNIGGVSATELKNYNRDMRIDCIILEPVGE